MQTRGELKARPAPLPARLAAKGLGAGRQGVNQKARIIRNSGELCDVLHRGEINGEHGARRGRDSDFGMRLKGGTYTI